MKVFRLNDYEWWAAETLEEAKEACLKQTGLDEDEAIDESWEPYEIPDQDLDTLTVTDDEGSERRTVTFRQAIDELTGKGQEFPCLLACSIW